MNGNSIYNNDLITVGILPYLPAIPLSRDVYTQATSLIANIFSFITSKYYYTYYILLNIKVYVSDYKLAYGVLHQFEISGIGRFVSSCTVKHMGSNQNLLIYADVSLVPNNKSFLNSKL